MKIHLDVDQAEMDILCDLVSQDIRNRHREIDWLIIEEGKRRGISYPPMFIRICAGRLDLDLGPGLTSLLELLSEEDSRNCREEIKWLLRVEGERRNLSRQNSVIQIPSHSVEQP